MTGLTGVLSEIHQDFALGYSRFAACEHSIISQLRGDETETPAVDVIARAADCLAAVAKTNPQADRDLLFSLLHYSIMVGSPDADMRADCVPGNREGWDRLLEASYIQSDFLKSHNEIYASHCLDSLELDDVALRKNFLAAYDVVEKSLLDCDDSVFYTKLNHGFWEFFLNSHAPSLPDQAVDLDLRVIDNVKRIRGERDSGFYIQLLTMMKAFYAPGAPKSPVELSIGIGAGEQSVDQILNKPLRDVGRGALMGLLAVHSEISGGRRLTCSDGMAPRHTLFSGQFEAFLDRFMTKKASSLLIVPSSLRSANFSKFPGHQDVLIMPRFKVHEAWTAALCVALGRIERLIDSHGDLVVFMQAANFSTLLAFALPSVLPKEKVERLTFFDLGRMLDVCRPDIVTQYPSMRDIVDNPREDYARFFKAREE